MSWASRRRLVIALIAGAVVIAFLTIVIISALYKTPSCTDGVQNQGEAGVDCGGACAYLCTAQMQAPVVLFTKAVSNGAGRTDVVAMVENKNATAAAKNVPYRITLYGAGNIFLKSITGTIDLPPNTRMPVYVAGVTSGNQKVSSAFLEVSASAPLWFKATTDPRIVPTVVSTTQTGTTNAPRIETTLANPSAITLSNVRAIAIVNDNNKNVIAASETVVPFIFAQGQAIATFTWNNAFASLPALIEVIPVIDLP